MMGKNGSGWRHRIAAILCAAIGWTLHAAGPISVSELHYLDPDDGDLDFIELINIGSTSYDLTGARFTLGITYTFSANTVLDPGERLVVVRDRTKFVARYGSAMRLAEGSFSGGFSSDGEQVMLLASGGATLLDFTFGTSGRWPSRPDGLGSTLECVDPAGDLNDPNNWRASAEWLGSPGRPGAGPQRVVVINEVLAHTDPPLEDAVELMNLTDQPVAIGGWYLSDSRARPKKFRIPEGTVIPAHGFIVFYEQAGTGASSGFNRSGTGDSPDFAFSSAYGEEAVLMSADAAGNLQLWMDTVKFEATANGVSVGRYPDGTGKLTTLSGLSFGTQVTADYPSEFLSVFRTGSGASNAAPVVGPVVFSQIQYHPPAGGDEFLELQNNSTQAVPLYDPEYPTNTWRLRDAIDFDFPPAVILEAGAKALVVPIDPQLFRMKYSIPTDIPVFGPWTNALNNAGERVALFQPDTPQGATGSDAGYVPYVVVEDVEYLPIPPWPLAADGTGPALRRKDIRQFGNDAANWEAESTTDPEPPILSIAALDSGVQLTFEAETGRIYRLEQTAALSETWNDLGVIPTSGGPVQVDLGSTPGFFRVRLE